MIPTLSQVCTLNAGFFQDLEDYAAGQCRSIEVWWTKLEQALASHSADAILDSIHAQEVQLPVASFQGGLLTTQGEARREAWQLFERRLELCQQFGIETVVVTCDIGAPLNSQDVDRVHVSLRQLADYAERAGRRIALEFQSRASLGNNLETAVALIQETGSKSMGICLDLFHFHTGPSKLSDLGLLTNDNLFHVQLCDLAGVPRELATDSERILPGEGDLPIDSVVDFLRKIGYQRTVSIELMNPVIWQVPPRQFGEIAMTALRKILGLASMD